jgi:hypothetical protein
MRAAMRAVMDDSKQLRVRKGDLAWCVAENPATKK